MYGVIRWKGGDEKGAGNRNGSAKGMVRKKGERGKK
jgi:hypothetical protein